MSGPNFMQGSNLYLLLGNFYLNSGDSNAALLATNKAIKLSNNNKLFFADCNEFLASIFNVSNLFRESLKFEKIAYNIYKVLLSDNHPKTKFSSKRMEEFIKLAVSKAKLKN